MMRWIVAGLIVFGLTCPVGAQERLRIATGGQGGTYIEMGQNMKTYCGPHVDLDVLTTGGTDDNIERLTSSNKADVGIAQKDILFKRANFNNDTAVKNLLAVMPLHGEVAHVIVSTKSDIMKFSDLGPVQGRLGGMIGGKAGKRVAAYGGSIESAEILRAMTDVAYEVVPTDNIDAALKMLGTDADAILAMGGSPLGWVNTKLNRSQHRMIPFDVPMEKVNKAYRRATITYTKLGVNAMPSVATDAILVTRNFTSPEKVAAVSLLRKCITTELTKMQEASDTHGQWQNVSRDNLQVEGWGYFAGSAVTWPPAQNGPTPAPPKGKR